LKRQIRVPSITLEEIMEVFMWVGKVLGGYKVGRYVRMVCIWLTTLVSNGTRIKWNTIHLTLNFSLSIQMEAVHSSLSLASSWAWLGQNQSLCLLASSM
jgi:hypothetical protein